MRGIPTPIDPASEPITATNILFLGRMLLPAGSRFDKQTKRHGLCTQRGYPWRGGKPTCSKEKAKGARGGPGTRPATALHVSLILAPPTPSVTRIVGGGCVSNSMVFMTVSAMAGGVTTRIHLVPGCQMVGQKYYISLLRSEIFPQRRSICPKFRWTQDGAPSHRGEVTM